MNPIEKLIEFFNILLACSAMAATDTNIGGQDFLVQHWRCNTTDSVIHIDAWRIWCTTNGYKYMGRPFFLEFDGHHAYYLDQFGYIRNGEGALLINSYRPPCGS